MQKMFEEGWRGWQNLKKYGLDSQCGFMIPQNYEPKIFKKQPLFGLLRQLNCKIQNKQIEQCIDDMQSINFDLNETKIDQFDLKKDCIYLHGLLTIILNAYLVEKRGAGLKDDQIIVPKKIGVPLYEVANSLKIKFGMCSQFYCNWRLKNQNMNQLPQDIEIQDIEMLFRFTSDEKDENMFFGGSLLGCFYLFKSIRLLYAMIQQIETLPDQCQNIMAEVLSQVCLHLKNINKSNEYILNNLTQDFLMKKLRKYVGGFKSLKFEGVNEPLTSDGGAGGFDPCYQIFQKMMGIKFQGPLSKTQQIFRTGFPTEVLDLINDMNQSPIRQYCQHSSSNIRKKYNDVVNQYGNFYVIHRLFIKRFITDLIPEANHGVGGVSLADIQSRAQAIMVQRLK